MLSRVVDVVAPPRLGTSFRWLLASSWLSNLGDGIALSAGPLLVASQTHDPVLVSLAPLLRSLPWLLLGLQAGALADRINRRVLVATVDLIRAGVLALLCTSIATHHVSVPVVLVVILLLATAEVFADSASQTLLPMLVDRDDLPVANARLQTGLITINQLAGPAIGAGLFAVGALWAFASQTVLVALGALLVLELALPTQVKTSGTRTRMRKDIAEGLSWVLHNAAMRTLVLTIFIFNITFGAAWSVLVLYARQRLHLGAVGFGLITTCSAVGGLVATAAYGWITRHVSLANLMRIGLIIETLTHLALAVTTNAVVALGIFTVFGAHAFVWMTTSTSVRQRAVPEELQGRVVGVEMVGVYSTIVVGSALGGVIAQRWGITAPFWFAFVGSAVFVVLIWGQLRHIAHADDPPPPVASAP
ncbi:MAG: major facilitator superfamily 1 [Frankiales bacterium]|nr:major facilitator superfamily 1 [Frankiales bacterium]